MEEVHILGCAGMKGTTVATWEDLGGGWFKIKVFELQSGYNPYVLVKAEAKVAWNVLRYSDKTLMLLKCLDSTAKDYMQESRWQLRKEWPAQMEGYVMEYMKHSK